jgi:colanic acid/amylovoran biosynthesis protein
MKCVNSKWIRFTGIRKTKYQEYLPELIEILGNTEFSIDLSGFALSSQWKPAVSLSYIYNLRVMKEHGIKTYLFPQSFGPFNYNCFWKPILFPLLKRYLQYPEKIYVREAEGFRELLRFRKKDLFRVRDLVLQIREPILENVYKDTEAIRKNTVCSLDIPANSVIITPNIKVMEQNKQLNQVYHRIIAMLLNKGKNVYLFAHSWIDREIAKQLKANFADDSRVVLFENELSAAQVISFFKKFEFIIAARFHLAPDFRARITRTRLTQRV